MLILISQEMRGRKRRRRKQDRETQAKEGIREQAPRQQLSVRTLRKKDQEWMGRREHRAEGGLSKEGQGRAQPLQEANASEEI